MTIWQMPVDLELLNRIARGTMLEHLGIELTAVDDESLTASMPVDPRTHQPMGILHGGASVALAESVGSFAANMAVTPPRYCIGLEINANHVRSVRSGRITARAAPRHLGGRTQVWAIDIRDADGRMVCVSRLTMLVMTAESGASPLFSPGLGGQYPPP